MRKLFDQQTKLGVVPISEVEISAKSRHQLPKLLIGLQHIYTTPELNSAVFRLLKKKILDGKKRTGRMGMGLWEIVVLGTVRLNMDLDYDALEDMANNHLSLRGILGVSKSDFSQGKQYAVSTIKDNVGLVDEELLKQINEVVVKAGHKLLKKKKRRSLLK